MALHGRNAAVVASLTPQSQAASNPCLNCGTNVQLDYCPECGQHALDSDPTLKEFLREMAEEFLHWDGKVVSTFRMLVTKPGELTREYVAGRRVRFISPLRVYLWCSVLYFFVNAIAPQAPAATGTRNAVSARIIGISIDAADVAAVVPKMMFVLVPLFAAFVMFAFRQSRRRFPQHLAFALHVHAILYLTLTLLLVRRTTTIVPIQVGAMLLGSGAVLFYLVQAMRTVYSATAGGAVARAAFVVITHAIAVAVVVAFAFGMVALLQF